MILGLSGDAGVGKDTLADELCASHGFVKIALADPLKRILADTYGFSRETLWGPSRLRAEPDLRYPRRHGPWIKVPGSTTLDRDICACCGEVYGSTAQCFLNARFALQSLGTGWGRMAYVDTWIDRALRDADAVMSGGACYHPMRGAVREIVLGRDDPRPRAAVVIPDMRYVNEMARARAERAAIVRVKREVDEAGQQRERRAPEAWRQHSSETEQHELLDAAFDAVFQNPGPLSDVPKHAKALLERLAHRPLR